MVTRQPVQWGSISLEEVLKSKDLRLEASVYATKARQIKQRIAKSQYNSFKLSAVVNECFYPGRFKRDYRKKSDCTLGFIGSAEMLAINPEPQKWMPFTQEVSVQYGQLLFSRSGTIGNVTFVNETLSKLLVSEHAIRMNVPEYTGYIYAFFKSKYGYLISNSLTHGSVVSQIEPHHLLNIDVPNAPKNIKQAIHQRIMDAFALRDKSNELLQQAQGLLQKTLQLPPLDAFKRQDRQPETWSVNVADLVGRFEAAYHNPMVHRIERHLQKHSKQVSTLADRSLVSEIILPGRYKRHYVEPEFGIPFLGGKEILELDPRGEKYLSLKRHSDEIANELTLSENMILVTRSGTIGKVVLVPAHWTGWAASEHLLRVKPVNDDMAGYLAVWLKSPWALPLIQRHTYGSVIFEIDQYHLAEVYVPLLDDDIMTQINTLALEANALRTQAFVQEQEALVMFEGIF
ncbi:MAG: hypothetical protein SOS93_00565 [Mannheimia varigena]|nr:hypothetical protein [Mannheimia varigena]